MISREIVDPDDLDYEEYSNMVKRSFAEILKNAKVANDYLNEKYFRWKYHTPYGKAVIAIIKDGSRILASTAMIPLYLKYKNSIFRGWQACDVAALPEMRGKSSFRNCIQMLSDYLKPTEIFFGFPNEHSVGIVQNIGWITKGIITTWINPRSVFADESCSAIRQIFKFDNLHDAFIKDIVDYDYVTIVKDSEYLNWRYIQNPIFQYHIFTLYEQGKRQGYIVARTADILDHQIAIVMDLCSLRPEIDIILLRYIAQWAKKLSRKTIVLLDNTLSLKIAFQTGFLPVWSRLLKKKQVLMCKPISGGREEEILKNRWHVQMGDWDGF
jgi:hypothetical protein